MKNETVANLPASEHYLPVFASFDTLDVVDVSNGKATNEEITALVTLQGLANRSKPRIYVEQGGDEGPGVWLNTLKGVTKTSVSDPWSLFLKYRKEVAGLVIYDPTQPDTINLATTIAGVKGGSAASPRVAEKLMAAPYQLPVLVDLRKNTFQKRTDIYQYALDNYWKDTTHRLIVGLAPQIGGSLRDYAVATKAMVIWLDPRIIEEKDLLDRFLADMPVNAPFLGYYPDPENGGEQQHVTYLSEHAKPSFPADFFHNASVFGGLDHSIQVPPIPAKPPLEKKVYVTFIISDGDNFQYTEHKMRQLWDDPQRGKVPIGWTVNPGLVDFAPNFLNYYWSTATEKDALIAGPSGMGYTYPNHWPGQADLRQYVQIANQYMAAAGLRVITVWDQRGDGLNATSGPIYAAGMPGLLGVTSQNMDRLSLIDTRLPQIGLHPAYGDSEKSVQDVIWYTSSRSGASGKATPDAPEFIGVQVSAWALSPTNLSNIMNNLKEMSPYFSFVRPDHFFMLIREANGLKVLPAVK